MQKDYLKIFCICLIGVIIAITFSITTSKYLIKDAPKKYDDKFCKYNGIYQLDQKTFLSEDQTQNCICDKGTVKCQNK